MCNKLVVSINHISDTTATRQAGGGLDDQAREGDMAIRDRSANWPGCRSGACNGQPDRPTEKRVGKISFCRRIKIADQTNLLALNAYRKQPARRNWPRLCRGEADECRKLAGAPHLDR